MQQVPPSTSPAPTGPLAGVRVVELGQLLAGPFCGQLLGDLGADVIKVEEPTRGDPLRQWGRELPKGQSLWWAIVGRNKRSVTLNLREPDGQEMVKRIIETADILIENFRPGTMEKWGLSYEALCKINPRLIMVRVSGYGQTGPYSERAGYGAIGEAMGGLRYIVGDPSTPPSRVGISIGDTLAAMLATIGALAALQERTVSGVGQVVDSAIYESVLAVMESLVPEWEIAGFQRERTGAVLPNIAPSNVYSTRDGEWVLIAANQDTVFARLCDLMGQPGLAQDERFATHIARGSHQKELDDVIGEYTRTVDATELEEILHSKGVPAGKIFQAKDMLENEHFIARESLTKVPHPVFGSMTMQNAFPRLSRTAGQIRWPGAPLGHHTAEVLAEVGISAEELSKFPNSGANPT